MTAEAPAAPNGAGGRPAKQLRAAQVQCVRRHVAAASKEDRTVAFTELYKLVGTDLPNLQLPFYDVFRRRLRRDHNIRCLRTGVCVPRHDANTNTGALRAEFVVRMSEAFEDETAGRGVVVWFDESYCHTHHKRNGTVVDMNDKKQFVERRRAAPAAATHVSSGGTLFILMHAATRDGLLVSRDGDGKPIKVSEDNGDYHRHITSDAICQW